MTLPQMIEMFKRLEESPKIPYQLHKPIKELEDTMGPLFLIHFFELVEKAEPPEYANTPSPSLT